MRRAAHQLLDEPKVFHDPLAVAIAGGFSPRAYRQSVDVTRPTDGVLLRQKLPVTTLLMPGDTVLVTERWF